MLKPYNRHDLVWSDAGLPYVVTRQQEKNDMFLDVAQCLSAEKTKDSRIATRVKVASVIRHEKPLLFTTLLDKSAFQSKRELQNFCIQLKKENLEIRVFGSYSWQYWTDKPFTHEQSDLDILLAIADLKQLDGLFEKLGRLEQWIGCRLDGELFLGERYFVAWREWFDTQVDILVKTNHAVLLMKKDELMKQCKI